MASNYDEVDFSSKIILFNDQNERIIDIGLTQRKTMIVLFVVLAIFFFILVAFNALEATEIVTITKALFTLKEKLQEQ